MAIPMDPADLKRRLEKKATIHNALQELESACSSATLPADVQHLWDCIVRCHTLLKTRHSNVVYWRLGRRCFESAKAVAGLPADMSAKLESFAADARSICQQHEEEPVLSSGLPSSAATEVRTTSGPSHLSDAGLVLEESTSTSTPSNNPSRQEQMEALHQEMVNSMQMMVNGMDQVTQGTEASIAELDNILDILRNQTQPQQKPPPASKKLLKKLPRFILSQEKLEELGKDKACPVCTDDLAVGDEVIILPCKHIYHPKCVQPWLNDNNSCPTCRHELETDDHVYEARKEREREEEEARRGAENALSHNEFMYI